MRRAPAEASAGAFFQAAPHKKAGGAVLISGEQAVEEQVGEHDRQFLIGGGVQLGGVEVVGAATHLDVRGGEQV